VRWRLAVFSRIDESAMEWPSSEQREHPRVHGRPDGAFRQTVAAQYEFGIAESGEPVDGLGGRAIVGQIRGGERRLIAAAGGLVFLQRDQPIGTDERQRTEYHAAHDREDGDRCGKSGGEYQNEQDAVDPRRT
jgi:hypothetical protein